MLRLLASWPLGLVIGTIAIIVILLVYLVIRRHIKKGGDQLSGAPSGDQCRLFYSRAEVQKHQQAQWQSGKKGR